MGHGEFDRCLIANWLSEYKASPQFSLLIHSFPGATENFVRTKASFRKREQLVLGKSFNIIRTTSTMHKKCDPKQFILCIIDNEYHLIFWKTKIFHSIRDRWILSESVQLTKWILGSGGLSSSRVSLNRLN